MSYCIKYFTFIGKIHIPTVSKAYILLVSMSYLGMIDNILRESCRTLKVMVVSQIDPLGHLLIFGKMGHFILEISSITTRYFPDSLQVRVLNF